MALPVFPAFLSANDFLTEPFKLSINSDPAKIAQLESVCKIYQERILRDLLGDIEYLKFLKILRKVIRTSLLIILSKINSLVRIL
jgi:hypothetical protein